MLLLSRKEGSGLLIGKNITVTVVSISGGKVVLGVRAPRTVAVRRDDEPRTPPQAIQPV